MLRTFLAVILMSLSLCVCAQSLPYKRQKAVSKMDYYVSPSRYDYSDVTREIIGDSITCDYEKLYRIYRWVCSNVSFDYSLKRRTADEAWDSRSAVCQGFCELMFRMARTQRIKLTLIYGKAKAPYSDNLDNHVWILANTDHGKILLDPTWGATATDADEWFDVSPEKLTETHFPTGK